MLNKDDKSTELNAIGKLVCLGLVCKEEGIGRR